MARTAWVRTVASLGGCLFAGCLFHRSGALPPTEKVEPVPLVQAAPPAEKPHSPYCEIPVQEPRDHISATFTPITPVKMEGRPTPPTKDPDPPQPPPPAPAPDAPPVAALKCALERHPDEARRLLEKYDTSDRELMLALIGLLSKIDSKHVADMPADEVARTLEQLRGLSARLSPRLPLRLDNVHFCAKIEGFGQYEKLPSGHKFAAGTDDQPGERMQVYVEVRNFHSAANQGQYETKLSSSLEIRDEHRNVVARMTPETSSDVSQTPRQDYFLNFQFHVPAALVPKLYTLEVVVKDVTAPGEKAAARKARCSLDFHVGPPGAPK